MRVKPFRWQEDCRNLRDQQASLGPLERLRYLPLNMSETVWLTLGAEYRLKTEYYNAPDFFPRLVFERYTAVGQRVLLHADLTQRVMQATFGWHSTWRTSRAISRDADASCVAWLIVRGAVAI